MLLGCVCFGWKWFQEIIFTLFRMFGCHRKWYFPENDFWLTNIFTFDRKWFSPLIFTSKHFRKKREREGERARAREEKKPNSQSISRRRWSPVRAPGDAISRRSRDRAVASSCLRSRSTRAVARSRSQIDREIAPSRARVIDCEIAISDRDRWWYFSWVCVFLLFRTPKNIFRKIFWNATKHREIFSVSRN